MKKFKIKSEFEILNKLFIEGDIVFISDPIHIMDGQYDYARKIFDENKNYLGKISDNYFEKNINHKITKI